MAVAIWIRVNNTMVTQAKERNIHNKIFFILLSHCLVSLSLSPSLLVRRSIQSGDTRLRPDLWGLFKYWCQSVQFWDAHIICLNIPILSLMENATMTCVCSLSLLFFTLNMGTSTWLVNFQPIRVVFTNCSLSLCPHTVWGQCISHCFQDVFFSCLLSFAYQEQKYRP